MSDDGERTVNDNSSDLDSTLKIRVDYQINIIHSEPNTKVYKEPYYIKDRRPSKSPNRSNSSSRVNFFKMNKKEMEIDEIITNKLKSTQGFEEFITDPQISKLFKKLK